MNKNKKKYVHRTYPLTKVCVICSSNFLAFNRYQATRNKLCSAECKKTFISRLHKGKPISRERVEKLRAFLKKTRWGERNPNWAGSKVGYSAIHSWVKRNSTKPKHCGDCGEVKGLDLANISQQYKRDLTDWEWLCRRCHMLKDGRLERFLQQNEKRKSSKML